MVEKAAAHATSVTNSIRLAMDNKKQSGSKSLNSILTAMRGLSGLRLSSIRPTTHWLRHICSGLSLAVFALAASAQTQTGGVVGVDTVWRAAQSPYVVTSDILVQNGATLTIEAGTVVYMGTNTRFAVQSGALKAIGTAQLPIKLTSQKLQNNQTPAPGDWKQLTFSTGITNTTQLEYVQIEYGQGIVVVGASPIFNYLTIRNNQGAAITSDLTSSPSGVGNQASGNTSNAIVVPAGDIAGNVTWGVRGIPYLVSSGIVSVGITPKILSVLPRNLQRGETQTITVTGSRLSGLTQPGFDLSGLSAQMLAGTTDNQAQMLITAASNAALGTAALTATADAGELRFPNAFSVVAVQPRLTSVTPSTLSTKQGDAVITLNGQNFTHDAVAYLDADALVTTNISATEMSAIVPNQLTDVVKSIELHTPNPAGGAAFVSNALSLTIITPPPVVSGITPGALRRGETVAFQIAGTGLNAVSIAAANASLSISDPVLTPTLATFKLTAAADAPLGAQRLTLTNSAGSASATLTVNPALPTASVVPTPIAVPPDGSSRQFGIQLSFADTVSHTFTVTAADPSVVKVSTASLTIAAGQVQAIGSISGLKTGVTSLTLVSPTLGTLSLPVYVTADFLGLNTGFSPLLGVVLTPPTVVQPQSGSAMAKNLGVVYGNVVQNVSPKNFATDSGTSTLTLTGSGLEGAISLALKPADGVTVGSVTVAADGKTVSVPLTVATDAPVSTRQVILSSATGPYPVARPDADRIQITLPHPEIWSIDPLFGTPGTPNLSVIIRGKNLQAVQSLTSTPADGITFGSSPTANADGSQLTAVMNIAPSAALGSRVITVNAQGSSSGTTPSAANTFTIINTPTSTITPVASPMLGVVKLDDTPPPSQTLGLVSPSLGVAYGSVAKSISPSARAIGESFTLTVQGAALQGVTAVSFAPATGITVGTATITEDGQSLTVPVSIAADALQTVRTVKLMAGAAPIAFFRPANAAFTVTAQVPVIESTDPLSLQLGAAPVTMTLRGKNFQNAQSVRFVPADGMTVANPPTVDASSTQLTINVSASSAAAAGKRAVIVTTPGGESSSELSVANTVTLGNTLSSTGLFSHLLGIVKLEPAVPVSTIYDSLVAPNLGVVFGEQAPPANPLALVASQPLSVALGPVASAVQPTSLVRSSSRVLTISGASLDGVTAVSINPSQGITLGTPVEVSVDGRQVTVPVSIASDAPMTVRQVLLSAGAAKVAFANPASATVQIASDAELPISSISPILSTTGSLLTLTVRGQNMQNATAVMASPGTGLRFDSQPTVSTDGTELTIRLQIAGDAPLGARVIQVITPTTASSTQGSPANTFTIYAP